MPTLQGRDLVLTALMLFLPLLDKQWSLQAVNREIRLNTWRGLALLVFVTPVVLNQEHLVYSLTTLLLVALPEEWYFRAYVMEGIKRKLNIAALQTDAASNTVTALFFSLMHVPTQGWFGLLVFFPALVYGHIYQKTRDLILVVLLHAISNQIFVLFIQANWTGYMSKQ